MAITKSFTIPNEDADWLWAAYGRVCADEGLTVSKGLCRHMREAAATAKDGVEPKPFLVTYDDDDEREGHDDDGRR